MMRVQLIAVNHQILLPDKIKKQDSHIWAGE